MSYRPASAFLNFLQSESGLPPAEDANDPEFHLVMRFINHHWSEHHPYGDTTAEERLVERVDGSEEFELDDSPITEEELRFHFGSDWVDSTIQYLEDHATEE